MAFELKQSLKLSQQLLMTPQLQQAIKLLQLSRVELEEFVADQLAENPVLEEGVLESAEEKVQSDREKEATEAQAISDHMESASHIVDKVSEEKGDWETFTKPQESMVSTSTRNSSGDDEFPNYENTVSKSGTLQEYLMAQLGEIDLSEIEKKLGAVIIGNIDEKGYLRQSIEEIAKEERVELHLVDDILDVIQRLEPPGIGARDLRECLQIQIRAGRLKNGIVEKIVELHLPALEVRNFNLIAKSLSISIDKVIENVQIISELEPIPGRQFSGESTQYIVPDVYVFKISGKWIVSLNEEGLPKLRVNDIYQEMLTDKLKEGKDKDYLQEKFKSATWLIKSIQQRQRTIFRVTERLVERQKDFFENGLEHLKPLVLRDIADDIGMHESTISRVTNNKFVHTPQGIFELKYFFSSSVSRSSGNSMASASVKKIISDLIKQENSKKPLADQKIVDILETKGIQVARRTVAKYREQLGILPSSKRKKYF